MRVPPLDWPARPHAGTGVSDVIFTVKEGSRADGEAIFRVGSSDAMFVAFEWADEIGGYREALIPSEVLNTYPRHLGTDCSGRGEWVACDLDEIPPTPERLVLCAGREAGGIGQE